MSFARRNLFFRKLEEAILKQRKNGSMF